MPSSPGRAPISGSPGRAPNGVVGDGAPPPARGLGLRPGRTPPLDRASSPPKGVAVVAGTAVATCVCAAPTVPVDLKGVAVVVGTALLPFAIVVAGPVCAGAAVPVDLKGVAVVVGTALLPFAIVVAGPVCAGAAVPVDLKGVAVVIGTALLPGGVGTGGGEVGSAFATPLASPMAGKPRPPTTIALATSCLSFIAHLPVSLNRI
jgi:hypothetical protein